MNSAGYGSLWVEGCWQKAHRLSWELHYGPIPAGLYVCHKCDEPACIRPDHCFLGTPQDNSDDMIAKGRERHARGERNGTHTHPERVARGERHGWYTHPESRPRGEKHGRHTHPERTARGEQNGLAKLTEAQVIEIRRLYRRYSRKYGFPALARRNGVDQKT
jgi:hypothetical protein